MRDNDKAPRLLNPDSEQAPSRSCVGTDRTNACRGLDHLAAARPGRSGHLIAAAISAAPFRPVQQRRERRGRWLLRLRERPRSCARKPPRIGPSASTPATPPIAAKQGRRPCLHGNQAPTAPSVSELANRRARAVVRLEPCLWVGAGITLIGATWLPVSDSSSGRGGGWPRFGGSFPRAEVAAQPDGAHGFCAEPASSGVRGLTPSRGGRRVGRPPTTDGLERGGSGVDGNAHPLADRCGREPPIRSRESP